MQRCSSPCDHLQLCRSRLHIGQCDLRAGRYKYEGDSFGSRRRSGFSSATVAGAHAAAESSTWHAKSEAVYQRIIKLVWHPIGARRDRLQAADRGSSSVPEETAAISATASRSATEALPSQPEAAWSAAWEALEVTAPTPSIQQSNRRRPPPWRRRNVSSHAQETASTLGPAATQPCSLITGSRPLESAQLSIQAIDSKARSQLLALSLSALEQQIAALPDAVALASSEDWDRIVSALLASCSLAAARAWLGYVPTELQLQTAAAVARLNAGSIPPGGTFSSTALRERKLPVESRGESSSSNRSAKKPSSKQAAGPSLWAQAERQSTLHASVVRFLRFGPVRDPLPPNSPTSLAAAHGGSESDSSSTESDKSSKLSDSSSADSLAAPPSSDSDHEAAASGNTQLLTGTKGRQPLRHAARQRLTASTSGVKGWRHQSLAQAWQGSAAAVGPSVIHDISVAIADAVATVYLAEARTGIVGGPLHPELVVIEGCWPVFLDRSLSSSRALECFRNEVAFHGWSQAGVKDIVAMYEDRHDVTVIAAGGALLRKSIPFKRTKELDALDGPRAALCLLLETCDVAAPFLRSMVQRLSSAISWLLTTLIGRSLGLIFRGIRQSVSWPKGKRESKPAESPERKAQSGPDESDRTSGWAIFN